MSKWKKATPGNGLLFASDGRVIDVARWVDRSKDKTGALVQMTYPHSAVHRDIIINANNYTVAGTTDILYFFTSGATFQPHLEYAVTASAAAQVLFYEAPAIATAGTAITRTRLFRPSEKTITATVTVGGTVTDGNYGTLLKHQSNGGGGQGSGVFGGSAVHDDAEWVLKLDTAYCLRIIRGASGTVSVEFEWYEVPEIVY